MQLIRTPLRHSSLATDFTTPCIVYLDIVYGCGPSPPISPLMLDMHRMDPEPVGIMTRAACFIPATIPRTLICMTWSNSVRSRSTMLGGIDGPVIPALLYIMSSFPWRDTVMFTASSTWDSSLTSHWTKWAAGPSQLATFGPKWVSISAMMTWAPFSMNSWAVALPSPLAAPVISATFPSSLLSERNN